MKHVKNFESYNEEVNWKALATGDALGASALIGCEVVKDLNDFYFANK